MRRRLPFAVLLLAALSLAVTTSAGKPAAPKPQNTPVAVTIADGAGYAIQSDDGAYVNGVTGVTAVIVPLGNLQLKTGTHRAFWLDFQGCVPGELCDPPFATSSTQGYMTTSCPIALLVMGVGEEQDCNLNVHFTASGLGWFIRFGEDEVTTPASVTRVDGDDWTIDVPPDGVALLQSYPLKGRTTYTDHGSFNVPVSLTVTLQ